jgi:hypothetical protein
MPRNVKITQQIQELFERHFEDGKPLEPQGQPFEKFAWIQKARDILFILEPQIVTSKGTVLISSMYHQMCESLKHINNKVSLDNRNLEIEQNFTASLASFEVLNAAMNAAPHTLILEEKQEHQINPYFLEVQIEPKENLVFVLMPFTESWSNRIWEGHIKQIVEGLKIEPKLSCIRADNLFGTDVLKDIYKAICEAKIVIADITGRNANVFYELGIAHSLGKKVILLAQNSDDIPFDLLRFRHIIYEDNSDGYKILKNQLEGSILEALQ